MGILVQLEIANDQAQWYFSDASYSMADNNAKYRYKWPSLDFPHCIAIHDDEMNDSKPIIRKWIEHNNVGTVIHDFVRKSYRIWWGESRDWDKTREISNCWHRFHFEESESSLMFALQFSDIVRPITEDHPFKHYGERYHH
jgi:hypothetical protein